MIFLILFCNTAIHVDTTLHSKCDQNSDLWQQIELTPELESDLRDDTDWCRKWLVDFNVRKHNSFHLIDQITLMLLMRKKMCLPFMKNELLRC